MSQSDTLAINVREILRSKAPNARVPNFLVRYLEKIVHQDELNQFLNEHGDLYGIDFVKESMKLLGLTIHTDGLEEIPEGRYTFAGTHPLGGIDGLSTGLAVYNRFPEQSIKFLSNDLLTNLKNLLPLFVPVNKVGAQSQHRSLPERLKEAYQSDMQMVIFPAGKCSRRMKGIITELPWSKSFIQKSIDSKRDVVPVYFEGRNSNFFYNFANLRTFLGIKTNFEMLYLADEMFKQRGKTFHIYFGKPIPYSTFDSSRTTQQWADWVREQSLLLAKKP
ncbi:MAG: glycerol acyltransferase [Bacteroidales bacterium]|nr:glycerol acyltransferase [Bacteroidales bacterium]